MTPVCQAHPHFMFLMRFSLKRHQPEAEGPAAAATETTNVDATLSAQASKSKPENVGEEPADETLKIE